MKKSIVRFAAILLFFVMFASLVGCDEGELFAYDSNGNVILNSSVGYIQKKYTADECRAEAERLFGTAFEIVSVYEPNSGEDCSIYTLRSEDIPFEISVFSEREPYEYDGSIVLYAHAYCDYYEQMMNYKDADASELAEKYGLEIERDGQCASVRISSYNQLEAVYEYLNATNELYNFTVVEAQMTNILRDIRSRPTLDVYLDRDAFDLSDKDNDHVITLYYTINHDTYYYTGEALLPAIQETYIDVLDSLGVSDSAVIEAVREERCKPALTQLCINGEPVKAKNCGDYILDPNIIFDYNWLLNNYYGDIRICAPAADYNSAPDSIGDDRNFKYLVELLGGRYESWKDADYNATTSYYSAEWWLGGNEYSAGALCQQYIPTMSAYSVNGEDISISHYYSKEMWGIENGYGPEDYYIRLTPEGLGKLLGVTVEADHERGTLNLITPEGYFDFEPPAEEESQQPEQLFYCEDVSINGIPNNATHYVIYQNDGTIMEERTTEQDTYAECEQLSRNVVLLKMHGAGMSDNITLFNTETGHISNVYFYGIPVMYPYVVYSPMYTDRIVIENVISGNRTLITDGAYDSAPTVISAVLSDDLTQITVTYNIPDVVSYFTETTETFDIVLPE